MSAELGWCGPMTRACVMAVCFAAAAKAVVLGPGKGGQSQVLLLSQEDCRLLLLSGIC